MIEKIYLFLMPLILVIITNKTVAQEIILEHPVSGAVLYQTIPYFSWEHDVEGYFTGYYQILIDDGNDFNTPVDIDTVPSFIQYYSPDFELEQGQIYYWKVRFLDTNYTPDENGWTEAGTFSIDPPVVVVDVDSTDDWDEIRKKWQTVLSTSASVDGAVELRFPKEHVFHIKQDSAGDESYPDQYLLYCNGYDNMIINGRGSKIIMEATLNQCGFLMVYFSNGMQVKDIIIDYHPNSLCQFGGIVKDFDIETKTFKVVVDTSVYQNLEEMVGENRGYFLDKQNKQRIGLKGVEYGMVETWTEARINDTLFEFTAGSSEWGRYKDEVKDGDYFVTSYRGGDIINLFKGVDNFVVNNLTTHGSRSRYFVVRVRNGSYIRCLNNKYLCTQGRIMGSPSGGVNDKGYNVWFENNRYEYTRDDSYHNGNLEGSVGAVFRRNHVIGSFRNSIWIQTDRSWVSENTVQYAGSDGIKLGYNTSADIGYQIGLGLIEDNKVLSSRWFGIRSNCVLENPDLTTPGLFTENTIIRGNTVTDHFRDQAIHFEYLKNSVVENNLVVNTINNWSVYSDPNLQRGINIVNSENVSGTGNQVKDTRLEYGNLLRIEENCINVTVSLLNEELITPSHLVATDIAYNYVDLSWKDNSSKEEHYLLLRRSSAEVAYSEIGEVGANITSYTDNTVLPLTTYYYKVAAKNESGISSASNELIVITPQWIVSDNIGEGLTRRELRIYPNPSNGIFWSSMISDFSIYTINGLLIKQEYNTNRIDLTEHPKGIYFLKDQIDGNVYKIVFY